MKRLLLILTVLLPSIPLFATTTDSDFVGDIPGLTIQNYPITDGSDSTEPLRKILCAKLFGFEYAWERSPFIQNPDQAPNILMIQFSCTQEEKNHLVNNCLLNNNTHQSFVNLIDNSVELIMTARAISRDEQQYANEQNVEIISKPIAKDALAFIVNPKNPINFLTIEQIQKIYTGEITNWKEVGGKDAPIVPFIRNRNSGSQEKFETMVMNGLTIGDFPELQIGLTMMSPYWQIENEENGIAFTPFYYYNVIVNNETTKAIGVNGIPLNGQTIKDGSYPYVSDVYGSVRADIDKNTMAYELYEYLTADRGQEIIEDSGYISLNQFTGSVPSISQGSYYKVISNYPEVKVISENEIMRIDIIDLSGNLLSSSKNDSIKVDHFPKGVYLLAIQFANGRKITEKTCWLN